MTRAELQALKARCLEAQQRGYVIGHASVHLEALAKAAGKKLGKDAEATPEALLALIADIEGTGGSKSAPSDDGSEGAEPKATLKKSKKR